MKSFAIVLAVCFISAAYALTDAQKAKLKEHRDACITETGVDTAKVSNAKEGNYDDADEKLACFSACLLKKIGIMNADGTFNEEATRAKIPPGIDAAKANEVINKCKTETGATDCETGRKLYKCYLQNKSFSVLD
nr:odorant-binding protein 7 [Gregopimpla kuwanae]